MNKILTGIVLILFPFLGKAQDAIIVHGYLNKPNANVSQKFKKNIFCHLKGNIIMSEYNRFITFRVDSVISGSFLDVNNEIKSPPFLIDVGLINECTILDFNQIYTLKIKKFPQTNYYYIDSLKLVYPNEKYLNKLVEYYTTHQQNVIILTKGTLQERSELLDKKRIDYPSDYADYRYIPYILPYMTIQDTIIKYGLLDWDGFDSKGRMIGGTDTIKEKGLYSDFLYRYLNRLSPFTLPPKTTDSIGWHHWYDSISLSENCFQQIKYCPSEYKYITNGTWIPYFITDTINDIIYFRTEHSYYILNMNTENLEKKPYPKNRQLLSSNSDFSNQDNEIPIYNSYLRGIDLYKLDAGVFLKQENEFVPLSLIYNETASSYSMYPHLIVHSDKDFFVFSSQNPDGYNYVKAGKINRKGKWIIEPKSLYKKPLKSYIGNTDDIGSLSFCNSRENEIVFSFSDRSYGRKSSSANEIYSNAIIVYKINAKLEVKDSVVLTIVFPRFDYRFNKTYLLKNENTYLLLAEAIHNNGYQLYYRLLNNDLTPITDFIKLANDKNGHLLGKPIITTEGFMLSWVDNDFSENVLRSVLIDKSGNQSKIINISNYKINEILNVEFNHSNFDIYLLISNENSIVRKRIDKRNMINMK